MDQGIKSKINLESETVFGDDLPLLVLVLIWPLGLYVYHMKAKQKEEGLGPDCDPIFGENLPLLALVMLWPIGLYVYYHESKNRTKLDFTITILFLAASFVRPFLKA